MAEYVYSMNLPKDFPNRWYGIRLKPGERGTGAFNWSCKNLNGRFANAVEFLRTDKKPSIMQYTYWFTDRDAALHFRMHFGGEVVHG